MKFCLQSFKHSLIQPRQLCSANVRYATNLSRFSNGGPAVTRTLDINAGDANFVLRDCSCNVLTAGEKDYVGRGGRKAERYDCTQRHSVSSKDALSLVDILGQESLFSTSCHRHLHISHAEKPLFTALSITHTPPTPKDIKRRAFHTLPATSYGIKGRETAAYSQRVSISAGDVYAQLL